MARKASLIGAGTGLAPVYLHAGLGEHRLEHQLYLTALPLLRQRELCLVQAMLVGNTLRCGLAVEAHAVLVCAEALQLPAGGHAYLGPLPAAPAVGALEVPLHHVIAAVAAEVQALGLLRGNAK